MREGLRRYLSKRITVVRADHLQTARKKNRRNQRGGSVLSCYRKRTKGDRHKREDILRTNVPKVVLLILMVGTAFKIFFMDLWRLGQLYRVASFVGLAAVLILVSFLYQRFMTGKDEEEKQGARREEHQYSIPDPPGFCTVS